MTEQQFICQRSGFKFPISEAVKEWTGLIVHRKYADKRNPQDFVTGQAEDQRPRMASPEPADTFINSWDTTPSDL